MNGIRHATREDARCTGIRNTWVKLCFCCSYGSANNWWERSPNGSNTTNFCNVNSNGNANNNNASNSNGVAFGFCKAREMRMVRRSNRKRRNQNLCRRRAYSLPEGKNNPSMQSAGRSS